MNQNGTNQGFYSNTRVNPPQTDYGMNQNGMNQDPFSNTRVKSPQTNSPVPTQELLETTNLIKVQGEAQKFCSFGELVNRVHVVMNTEECGPLRADIDLWEVPSNTAQAMTIYLEDGKKFPFRAIIETPGDSSTLAIRNTSPMVYPFMVGVETDRTSNGERVHNMNVDGDMDGGVSKTIYGNSVFTKPFPPKVQSVAVSLKSNGRPINARVELLQGPNNIKQDIEIFLENGLERPAHLILDTPGKGSVVRVTNIGSLALPFSVSVGPYIMGANPPKKLWNWS